MNFCGKCVIVTGAGSGMGAATAKEFAKLGAKVALVDRYEDKLKEIAEKCTNPCDHLQIKADMCDECDVEKIMSETKAKFKKLDVLVNGAGIMESANIENTTLELFDRTINTNLRSMYQLITLAVPELKKTKGNIVNISSVCGLRSFPNLVAYNISKAGVDQLTRSVALDLGLSGVRCNAVNPGVIVTGLHKSGGMSEEEYKKFLERGKITHALGRVGQPHEVSGVICFLASELASFITGVTLSIDGGRHAMCPR